MSEHIVVADDAGCFYCRAVDSILNYKRNEHVCGRGCPCFAGACEGRFVCCYEEEGAGRRPALFPLVRGLDPALQKAYEYAAEAHSRQHRKGTRIPYFTHIITTMNYAVELTDDVEILQAAALHDTIEDTSVTMEDLEKEFGGRVAALVEAETENKRHELPASQTWEIRKREAIERIKTQALDVKIIVLADKTANAESLVKERQAMGDGVWEKFNQTDAKMQEWYFRSMRAHLTELDDTQVMKQFDKYIKILFG